jgi:hypothetical protein
MKAGMRRAGAYPCDVVRIRAPGNMSLIIVPRSICPRRTLQRIACHRLPACPDRCDDRNDRW